MCECVCVCVCVHSSDESTIFQISFLIFDETPSKILLCLVEIALSALSVAAVSNLNYEKYSIATLVVKCVCVYIK